MLNGCRNRLTAISGFPRQPNGRKLPAAKTVRFPWGNDYDPARLNSNDLGPFDTSPVGEYPAGVSPYGMLDTAGQVFEWTASGAGDGRHFVKGGSWDDKGCGICRLAARQPRPEGIKHILVGFRLIDDGGR
ncbi:MAG: formylglycine-generating enzyme family protein [Rhodospirillales bacterium]